MDEAVILAAGEGTRLRPLTSTRPKPMLPVAGKPILEWDIEALAGSGFRKIYVVVGYRQDVIKEHFKSSYGKVKIEYVVQTEQLGTGHAVSLTRDYIKGDEFLVVNGDVLVTKKTISDLVRKHKGSKAETSICLTEVENPSDFGVIELDGDVIKNIVEKPEKPKSSMINAGVYIFGKRIFDVLQNVKKSARFEYEITDAIKSILASRKTCGFKMADKWIDIGRPWDLLDANEILLKKMDLKISKKAVVEEYTVLSGKVHVGGNTVIRSGSYIIGPCFIGNDCVIGPNCFIRPYTVILNKCHIGNGVEVKNSIVMSNSNVPHLSYVGDSIISEHCNLGAGTKIANLRFDNAEVKVEIKKQLQGSGRRKFGCLMGDNVKTGINVSIMPGRSIYPNALIEAGSVVRNTIYTEPEK